MDQDALTQYLAVSAYVRAHPCMPHTLGAVRPHTLGVSAYLRAHPKMLVTAQLTRAHVAIYTYNLHNAY